MADGSYQLGGRLLDLARVARGPVDLIHVARPFLEALASATGEQVFLSRLAGHIVVCIDQVEAQIPRLVRIAVGPGDSVPLRRGAAAKAILAHLPPHKVLALLERAESADPTPQTPRSREQWLAELAEVRRQGYAVTEFAPEGLRAVAAAIVAPRRELAALTVAGPAYCLTDERLPGLAEKVCETGTAITARLMDTPRFTPQPEPAV
jgi:DNA-binding IclR family transcriptional regulator